MTEAEVGNPPTGAPSFDLVAEYGLVASPVRRPFGPRLRRLSALTRLATRPSFATNGSMAGSGLRPSPSTPRVSIFAQVPRWARTGRGSIVTRCRVLTNHRYTVDKLVEGAVHWSHQLPSSKSRRVIPPTAVHRLRMVGWRLGGLIQVAIGFAGGLGSFLTKRSGFC